TGVQTCALPICDRGRGGSEGTVKERKREREKTTTSLFLSFSLWSVPQYLHHRLLERPHLRQDHVFGLRLVAFLRDSSSSPDSTDTSLQGPCCTPAPKYPHTLPSSSASVFRCRTSPARSSSRNSIQRSGGPRSYRLPPEP